MFLCAALLFLFSVSFTVELMGVQGKFSLPSSRRPTLSTASLEPMGKQGHGFDGIGGWQYRKPRQPCSPFSGSFGLFVESAI